MKPRHVYFYNRFVYKLYMINVTTQMNSNIVKCNLSPSLFVLHHVYTFYEFVFIFAPPGEAIAKPRIVLTVQYFK